LIVIDASVMATLVGGDTRLSVTEQRGHNSRRSRMTAVTH
jgi:hypothetical protein